MRTCEIEGCEAKHNCRGYCIKHYRRFMKWGDPLKTTNHEPISVRVSRKVAIQGECHVWTGGLGSKGYPQISNHGKIDLAHRALWIEANGHVGPEVEIDHSCRNRLCLNIEHLRPTTKSENGQNKSRKSNVAKSGVRGVFWNCRDKRWAAVAKKKGKGYYAGQYLTIAEAEAAVIALRNRIFTHNDDDRQEVSA